MAGFHHYGRVVSDIDAALAFYRDQLGFEEIVTEDLTGVEIEAQVGLSDVELRVVMLTRGPGGPMLELLHYRRPPSPPGARTPRPQNELGSDHMCILVDDINAEYERLLAAGVQFTSPPQYVGAGHFEGDWCVFCLDPDGLTVELWQAATR